MNDSSRVDINSPASILSAVVLGTIGVLSFIVQPGLVQGFVTELGVDEAGANDLAFAEMLGVALAAYLVVAIKRAVDWRWIVGLSLLLAALSNIGSAALLGTALFEAVRFATGLGEGGVICTSFMIIGLTRRTERNLAFYLLLLLSYGAVGLWAMPWAFDAIGLAGIFSFWAVLTVVALITLPYLPASAESRAQPSPTAAYVGIPMLGVALLAVLLYNTAIGAAWANLFLIGMETRPDEQAVANALLAAQFVAIPGALVPAIIEAKFGRWLPLGIGIFGGAGAIALLLGEPTYAMFFFAVCAFNFLWNFGMPFVLSSVGDMVVKGEIISAAVAMQMTGLGGGPFVAARILESGGGFRAVELAVIGLLMLSFCLLAAAKIARRRALAARL